MKTSIALKISLLIFGLAIFASCSSSEGTAYGASKSSRPAHCEFKPHSQQTKKKAPEAPPSKVTPIGGNYKVRN